MSALRRLARSARALPLRTRWLIAIVFYAVLIAAVVIVVRGAGTGGEGASVSGAPREEAQAAAEADREGRTAIAQDERPHTASLPPGAAVLRALTGVITSDVHHRIAHGELTGPLQSVRCQPAGAPRGARRPFHCTVRSAGIAYPFLAVADEGAHELTWCKLDPPPQAGEPLEVPVSPSCRA
ncbi:MAG TPA: hypothetical protein VMF09_06915 [Solirubrobacteraceae bacterium]|nr:hypothetical protein [Solirubrobacteraceae bacterium]